MKKPMALVICFGLFIVSISTFALTNSKPALEDKYNIMVAIRNYAPDAKGDDAPAFCVGTLLNEQEIVTAAHCVKDLYFHPELEMQIDLGYYKYITRPTGERVRVGYYQDMNFKRKVQISFPDSLKRKLAVSKKKATIGPEEDVALIRLAQPLLLTREISFGKIVSQTMMQDLLKNPTRHQLWASSINFIEESSSDTRRIGLLDNIQINRSYIKSTSTSRVAPGDSGAPVFYQNQNQIYLVAVVKGLAKTVFSNWDVYTLVEPFLCKELRHPQCL